MRDAAIVTWRLQHFVPLCNDRMGAPAAHEALLLCQSSLLSYVAHLHSGRVTGELTCDALLPMAGRAQVQGEVAGGR